MPQDLFVKNAKDAKIRLALFSIVAIALVFAWFAVRWQFGDMLGELTTKSDPNALVMSDFAVLMAPSDPQTHLLRASLQQDIIAAPDKTESEIAGFLETVRLSPYDYRLWIQLGRALEQAEQYDRAEAALKRAVDLAPSYTFPRWHLGNFYLRQNRPDDAFAELKSATIGNLTYRDQVFALAWDYFGNDPAKLEQIVADREDVHASLALFYAVRGRPGDSLRMWNLLSDENKAAHQQILRVIAQGLYDRRYFPQALEFARQLGMDLDAQPNTITNPSFEKAITDAAETRFGWKILRGDSKLDVTSDNSVRHDGARSLKITFRNYNKPDLYNVLQTVVVEPKRNYRLTFWVRTENLKSAGGPLLEVINANDDKLLATSKTFPLGTNDWQEFTVDFTTSENCNGITVRTGRSFCGDACPIAGIFWYDQFEITRE